jgi:hypothetical protein
VARQLTVLALSVLCLASLGAHAEAQQCPDVARDAESSWSMTFAYPFNGTIVDGGGSACTTTCGYCRPPDSGTDYSPRKVIRYTITSTLTDASFTASLFNNGTATLVTTSTAGTGSAVWHDTGLNQTGEPRGAYERRGNCPGIDPDSCAIGGFALAVGALSMTATGPNPSGSVTISWSFVEEDVGAHFTLTKQTTGGDGTFRFTGQQAGRVSHPTTGSFDPLLSTTIATTGGSGTGSFLPYALNASIQNTLETGVSRPYMKLRTGTYSLIEEPTAGFVITGITCTGADSYSFNPTTRLLTITVSDLATVACTSTSVSDASSITLTLPAVGGDDTFAFTSSIAGSTAFNIVSSGGTGSRTFANVANGTYTITESALAGWSLTGLACTGGTTAVNLASRTVTITIAAAGTNVACTFTNTKHGTISITKATINGNDTFAFTSSNAGLAGFNLTTSGGTATLANASVLPGTYTITEGTLAGWSLTGLTCSPGGVANLAGRSATITVEAGESYDCTFTSTRMTGAVTFSATAVGGDGSFAFTSSNTGAIANFSLTTAGGSASTTLASVTAGTYTITQGVLVGWDVTAITCTGGTPVTNVANRTATITVAGGDSIACTFTNARRGTISITKTAVGSDGTFAFTSSNAAIPGFSLATAAGTASRSFSDLATGTYVITESAAAGWTLTGLACTGGTVSLNQTARTASITLAAGQAIACTFTNTRQMGSITLAARTIGGDGTVSFASPIAELNTSLTTSGGTAQKVVSKIPGTYTITQTAVTGGRFQSVACTGGTTAVDPSAMKATITLATNDNVTCTFTSLAAAEVVRQTQRAIARFTGQRASRLASINAGGNRGMARLGGGGGASGPGFNLGPVAVDGQLGENGAGRFAFSTSLSQIMQRRQAQGTTQIQAHAPPAAGPGGGGPFGALGGPRRDGPLLPEGAPEDGLGPRGAEPLAVPGMEPASKMTPRRAMETVMRQAMGFSGAAVQPISGVKVPRFDVWMEGELTRYRDGPSYQRRTGDLAVVSTGADYLLNPWLMLGVMAQVDWSTDLEDQGARVKGLGWMAGPTVDIRLSPSLFAHLRGMWGRSSNEISLDGSYTDTFETTRAMYRASLNGQWRFDDWRLTPSITVAHFTEQQHAYVDSLGNAIAGTQVSLSRLTFGPEIGYRIELAPGWQVEPSAAVYGVWDFSRSGTGAIDGEAAPASTGMHLRLQSGIGVTTPAGISLRAAGRYDGLGDGNFRAWGGHLQLRVPLQ